MSSETASISRLVKGASAEPAADVDWFETELSSGTTDPIATIGMALGAIRSNATRSLLTALGVIIGVASVVALTAIGSGATRSVTQSLESLGTNLLTVSGSVTRAQSGAVRGDAGSVTVGDAEAIEAMATAGDTRIAAVAPVAQTNVQARAGSYNTTAQAIGTWANYPQIRDLQLESGAWWTDLDVASRTRVAVIGAQVANELFPDQDAVGQTLRLGTHTFTVTGVLPDMGASFNSPNRQVLVPLTTYLQRLARSQTTGGTSAQSINQVLLRAADARNLSDLQADVTAALADRRGEFDPDNYTFQVQNQADTLASLTATTRTLTVFLAAIAGISLLVGGIGIMNIMLVSVTERTREIGIRKALGARPSDVRTQFLVEASVLAAGGGLLGLAFGVGGAYLAGPAIGITPSFSSYAPMILAFSVALVTGLVFGIYPAQRAARLNAVDSLRYE